MGCFSAMMLRMEEKDDLKKILLEHAKIAEENNKILKKIHRSMKVGGFFRAIYWIIIAGSAVGAYYFLQPFVEGAQGTLETLLGGLENFTGIDTLLKK